LFPINFDLIHHGITIMQN